MTYILARSINLFSQVLTFIVLAHVILSYFMDPYHPIRRFVDRIVEPMLAPIRRVIPMFGMMDFSPAVLLILIQLISGFLVKLFLSF